MPAYVEFTIVVVLVFGNFIAWSLTYALNPVSARGRRLRGLVCQKKGRIWPLIVAHGIFNFVAFYR